MADGEILSGQDYQPQGSGITRRFTEQVKDYDKATATSAMLTGSEGTAGVEITPMDRAAAKVRTWDLTGIAAELAASVIKVAGKTRVDLPDVLTGLTSTYNQPLGVGAGSHPSSQQGFVATGTSGSGSLNPRATAQASAAILPDLQPAITTYRNLLVPCTHVFFYSPIPVTIATVLSRLTTIMSATVTDLPVFKEKIYTFTLKGMQVSIRQSAETRVSAAYSDSGGNISKSYDYGDDKAGEVGVSVKTITLPPVINGSITISSATDSQAVSISVDASSMAITGDVTVSAITNTPTSLSATASAAITPSSISATSPASVPTTGLYLVDLQPSIGEFGHAFIHAVVVDFSVYA